MNDTIRTYLENNVSRRALFTVGSYVGGACFGYVDPAGLEMLHEAFITAMEISPFTDPSAAAGALFDGAQYHAAATMHTVGEWLEGVGSEIGHQTRSVINEARDFIGPSLDQARAFFLDNADQIGESAARIRDAIRNAGAELGETAQAGKDLVSSGFSLLRTAAEAYGIYEAGKAVYTRLFGEAKEAVRETSGEPASAEDRLINLNVNLSVAGAPAANTAMRHSEGRDPAVSEMLDQVDEGRIIWVSDKLKERLTDEMKDMLADMAPGTESRVCPKGPRTTRTGETGKYAHRDTFPMINWDQSPVGAQRLGTLKSGAGTRSRRTPLEGGDALSESSEDRAYTPLEM